jgi:coproporphyrinogen III oxidase-like Fe-S oxidoreductase
LGVASFGHVGGVHMQNEKDTGPYYERIDKGEIPIRRAYALSDEERMIREFVLQLKLGSIRRDCFQEKHSVDIHERFASGIAQLEQHGLAMKSEDGLTLTRRGLLRVDGLLPVFFQEEHRSARYV